MTSAGGGVVLGGPRIGRRAALAGAVGGFAALSTGCTSAQEQPEPGDPAASSGSASPRFPGDPGPGRVYFGVSLAIDQPAAAQVDLGGESIALARRFYRAHQIELMRTIVSSDARSGVLPFVSFKVDGSWQSVADGEQDRWLDHVLEALEGVGVPAMVSLHHEPENDVDDRGDTAASWVAMQNRLIRRAAGSPLVTPVPILMNWTFQARSRDPQEWLVPESPVMGIDIYNPWQPDSGAEWADFSTLYQRVRKHVPDQVIVVPELGTAADPFDPTRAALWLRGAFETALREGIVGLAWFDARLKPGHGRELDAAGRQELIDLLGRPEVARIEPSQT